jgi:hypothetical protein
VALIPAGLEEIDGYEGLAVTSGGLLRMTTGWPGE